MDAERTEPDFGPLVQAAVATHELYLAFTGAGFTQEEALYLVGQIVTSTLNGSNPGR